MQHTLPIRIYYEDTDAGGVVYHANYLNFAERGRTEFLRATGFENNTLEKEEGILFVVRHIDIDYLKPSFLDDSLELVTTIQTMKNTSFTMHQRAKRPNKKGDGTENHDNKSIYGDENKEEAICDMHVVIVCVDTKDYKPVRIPETVKAAFRAYLET
jgi:acyl-CoA thioester hydrolase